MATSKLRIKLYFSDESPLFWTQVDLNKIKTVQDLSEEIVKKHQNRIKVVRSKSIQLMLDDAILPNEESITILEKGEVCCAISRVFSNFLLHLIKIISGFTSFFLTLGCQSQGSRFPTYFTHYWIKKAIFW